MACSKIFLLLYFFINPFGNCFGIMRHYNHDWVLKLSVPDFAENITEQWIKQPLDHFHANDTRTWPMRYFETLNFWRPGGPIIIFIGGESSIAKGVFSIPVIRNLAEEAKGAMFATEHRFYGESVPFKDLSTKNLMYLSSKQALADLKYFITQLKSREQFKKAKVVVIGGSYSGNLAAWARYLFPGLVDAALASSAPVLAKADFSEYFDVIGEVYQKFNPKCSKYFVNRNKIYIHQLQTPEGREQFKRDLNICDNVDMSEPNNVHLFFYQLMVHQAGLVQNGNPKRIEEDTCPGNVKSIFTSDVTNVGTDCINYDFKKATQEMRESNDPIIKSWYYQKCTEFGYFKTNSPNHYLSINISLNFHFDICKSIFGPEFDGKRVDDGVRATNEMYQGLKLKVSKVFFVNGDMDPWHKLGIVQDLTEDAPARVIADASHCADLYYKDNHNKEIPVVIELVKKKIKEWIGM